MTDAADGVNWIKISDATASGRYIYSTAEKIKPAGVARSRLVKEGDFLLSNSMSFGRPYILRTTGCIHDGWLVLSGYQESFDQAFLYHVLGSPQVYAQFDRLAAGSTVRNLNIDLASRVVVPVPPVPEQRRIVAILDEAFEAIATAKANTEKNLRSVRDAYLAFRKSVLSTRGEGWEEKQLGRVCVLQRGLDLPSRDRTPGPYPLLSSSGLIDTHAEGPVRGPGVVTGRSGSIGSVFYVEQDFWPLNTVLYVRDFYGNHPRFVYHLLEHFDLKRFASGAGVPTLNRNFVHDEIVLIPQSVDAQEKVAESLDKLHAACQKVEQVHVKKLSALDELKKSLLHQAFSGQLTAKAADEQLETVT